MSGATGIAVGTAFRPFVPRLAARWDATSPGERSQTLEASLLGLDISGFTALSERLAERGKLGAEELISLISACYSGLIDIAERYEGDVLKFRGDALLLLFDGDRHEERAALAALAMQVLIAETGRTESSVGPVALSMAGGLVTGPCHFFLLGQHHRELIVCGPTASHTLELEDAAEAGEVLVSARTAEALVGMVAGARGDAFLLNAAAAPAELPPVPESDELPVPPELVPPLLRLPIEEDAVESEHRYATAAFVKFSGSDTFVDDPVAAESLLGELADVVSVETHERAVTWLESDIDVNGGKLYLVAGAPVTGGDDEERMLRTVRAIVDGHAGPPIAVGVNRGRVVAGPIGSERRRTYAVMGDTVNLAARLTARAEKGEILASGDVLERSRARFDTTSRQFLMKGKARPVTGYSLGALTGEAADEAPQLPLVGREAELAVLGAGLESARMRQSAAVELVGDAGAGKSRLLDELVAGAAGFQVLRARCESYSASTPFAPFRSLLRPLVGILPDEPAEAAGAKLTSFVQSVMPELAQWLPLLALPFDAVVASTPEVDETDPTFRRDRLHDVLDSFLVRLLLMPTAILVEDTHWLDDASQLVLAKLAEPGPRPWLVVATRRPSGIPVGGTVVELEPLGADDARRLALLAAGDTPIPEAELAALTERAAGNPLFLRELAVSPSGADELPETIDSLLTTRIDTLHPADRLLLRHASVIGASFGIDLLGEILPEEAADPDRWSRLADFVDWDGPSHLRFRHDLVHAAAYDGLSYARRREIHALVGNALERRSFHTGLDAGVLSLHFLAAGDWAKAWSYSVTAGDDARSKYANIDAGVFYERALAAAGGHAAAAEELARVCEALGDVRELAARYEEADTAYERALGHGAPRAPLLRKRGVLAERQGRYDDALALYDEVEAAGDTSDRVAAQLGRAVVLYRQGRIDAAADAAAGAADAAIGLGDQAALADAYYIRAAAEGDRGGPAGEFLDLALPIFEELGLLSRQATVLNNMGVRAYYEGRWDDALALYGRSEEVVRRSGDVLTGGHAANNRAEILLDQGRLTEAAELYEQALRTYRAAKFPVGEAFATMCLGRIAAEEGRFDDAHRLLDDARGRFEKLGNESLRLEAEARRAQAFVLEGRHADAHQTAQDALDRTRAIGEVGVRLVLLERLLAVAAVQSRDRDSAEPHFAAALRIAHELDADYEVARTLQAKVLTGFASNDELEEAQRITERLGVRSLPDVPLP